MRWEELTAPEFAKAVRETGGVCVLAVGCVEKHFDHLPLGTDYLNAQRLCVLAAEKEPAVVFPPYYFGQVHESRPFPGAVTLPPVLTLELLLAVCDEIARNGFRKIILYNGHGGNTPLLAYLAQAGLAERKPYAVYLAELPWPAERKRQWDAVLETKVHGHACECETSITLANFPELVKMDAVRGRKTEPLDRYAHLGPGRITGRWYANYPDHYAGDATAATAEKGKTLRGLIVDSLADYIRAVRNDDAVRNVLDEFYDRCERLADQVD